MDEYTAGFDSPEVAAQIRAAFDQMREALAVLADRCRELLTTLADAIKPLIQWITRTWRAMLRLRIVPQQYLNTIAKRKMRRHILWMARRS